MNDFFRSKTFKIIAVLLAAVLAFFLRAVYTGGLMPALSHIGGAVATPFGEFFAGIGNGIQDFFQPIFHGRELQKENEDLQKLVDELTRRQADYDELKNQNDLYRRFFSISDSNADYTLEPATVIAHVPDDPSGSFIINIGQSQGIASGMPVITENGLVGIVGRVSERYCRVLTLMDPAVNIGVLDSTTLDTGILTGDAAMSEDNTARLTYLRLQSEAAAGDLILTSGYGEQIPQGLTVGYLSEVSLAATTHRSTRWKLGARLAKAAEKPCPMWSSFSEASAPGASRTPWQSLSKRYTKMRYGRLRMICFFTLSVIAPPPGPWS